MMAATAAEASPPNELDGAARLESPGGCLRSFLAGVKIPQLVVDSPVPGVDSHLMVDRGRRAARQRAFRALGAIRLGGRILAAIAGRGGKQEP